MKSNISNHTTTIKLSECDFAVGDVVVYASEININTLEELSQVIARRFRIALFLAKQVVNSLVRSGSIDSFGGYIKPKAVQS